MIEHEEWRPVVDYEGLYEVSSWGRVRSLNRTDSAGRRLKGKVLSPGLSNGYPYVCLHDGESKVVRIHELVASAFLGEKPEGSEVNHIDGNKRNNRSTNLEYVTHGENIKHAARNGLMGKLSVEQVQWLRDEFAKNPKAITVTYAQMLGVDESIVRTALRCKTYASIPNKDGSVPQPFSFRLEADEVIKLQNAGMNKTQIAEHFGVNWSTVWRALRRGRKANLNATEIAA